LKKKDIIALFKATSCCVLIPTYNNAGTIKKVIESVSRFTEDIIVVNDGSTDDTNKILQSIPNLHIISYTPNKGKGVGLRKGFEYAYNKGFRYAISIDSDGQHFAEDLPLFLEKLKEESNAIIIGARNMQQASIPGKSSFGHKFSNFWFKLETGIDIPDTQSGFRLYPLEPLSKIKFYTWKYEFEIEVIVKAAWRGINICSVPINVYYPPPEERVSSFRPFKDFSRISVLNTLFVIAAVLYYIPLRLIRKLQKKSFKQLIHDNILDGDESNLQKSYSIALGVFIGITPIWGYQILSAIAIAHFLKLNKVLVVLASNISLPPFLPFIFFLSYKTGGWLLGSDAVHFSDQITWIYVKQNFYQYLLGSIFFAAASAFVFGVVAYFALSLIRAKR
jgi:glycosyltransferase involved in cell wall biosynthesis